MKQTLSISGPRSWATLVIIGGAALSFPFLRKEQPPAAAATPIADVPDYSQQSWPDVRVQQLEDEQKQPSTLTDEDWNDLAKLQRSKSNHHQGNPAFPSTAPLPKWANHGARVDQIVSATMNRPPLSSEGPNTKETITPFRTWVDPKLSSDTTPALVNRGLTESMQAANESDSRWASPDARQSNPDSLVSGPKVKPFETKPVAWPDELKMQNQSSAQIASTPKSFADKNVVAYQPWNDHREPSRPSMVSTPIIPSRIDASPATTDKPPASPPGINSSQFAPERAVQFHPPQLPAAAPSNSRSKYFIQQPMKGQGQLRQ